MSLTPNVNVPEVDAEAVGRRANLFGFTMVDPRDTPALPGGVGQGRGVAWVSGRVLTWW